jgi:Pyruvate/2-oxoacid:ferredoxin oxidoreductase delta subunit
MAQGTIASGVGEALSRAEVLGLLDRAEREGMVLQPSNTQEPVFMCFCCGCCCGVLTIAKRFPRPAEYLHSNYQAVVDPEQCTACETCRSRCPMEALHAAEGATAVDLERCIGCGLCVSTCPTGAVGLVKKAKETVPPRDLRALYGRIAVDRFGLVGAATKVARALLGRPI